MKVDERFYPKNLEIEVGSFIRHFERYFQCIKMLGNTGKDEK